MRRIWTSLALATALMLPLAACGGQEAAEPEPEAVMDESADSESMEPGENAEMEQEESEDSMAQDEAAEEGADETSDEASDETSEEMSDESGDESEEMAETEDEAEPAVEVKTGLEATDPSTVQLASGQPQLVEFFAFW